MRLQEHGDKLGYKRGHIYTAETLSCLPEHISAFQ